MMRNVIRMTISCSPLMTSNDRPSFLFAHLHQRDAG